MNKDTVIQELSSRLVGFYKYYLKYPSACYDCLIRKLERSEDPVELWDLKQISFNWKIIQLATKAAENELKNLPNNRYLTQDEKKHYLCRLIVLYYVSTKLDNQDVNYEKTFFDPINVEKTKIKISTFKNSTLEEINKKILQNKEEWSKEHWFLAGIITRSSDLMNFLIKKPIMGFYTWVKKCLSLPPKKTFYKPQEIGSLQPQQQVVEQLPPQPQPQTHPPLEQQKRRLFFWTRKKKVDVGSQAAKKTPNNSSTRGYYLSLNIVRMG